MPDLPSIGRDILQMQQRYEGLESRIGRRGSVMIGVVLILFIGAMLFRPGSALRRFDKRRD